MYLQVDISSVTQAAYIAVVIFLVILFSLLFFVYQYRKSHNDYLQNNEKMSAQFERAILDARVEVQESTLATLGEELHDNIGQLLTGTKILLGVTQRSLKDPPLTLTTAEKTLGKAIDELRALSKSLTKDWLEQFDLIENISTEIRRLNATRLVEIHLSCVEKIPFETSKQLLLFRVIQEALQNAMKHSACKFINIDITITDAILYLLITDDGSGFDSKIQTPGVGLLNIRHRIAIISGFVEWITSPGNGCTIKIELPYNKDLCQ